jgi:hypothetical protein
LSNIKQQCDYEIVDIPRIQSKEEYSHFIYNDLNNYIDTDFVILVQWDGFILNPQAWTDEFLDYDYVGAPWAQHNHKVGNGGFSLRSKKLLTLTQKLNLNPYHPEDDRLCFEHRELLEKTHGIKYAPKKVASQFAVENEAYYGSFGWHGGGKPPGFEFWRKRVGYHKPRW